MLGLNHIQFKKQIESFFLVVHPFCTKNPAILRIFSDFVDNPYMLLGNVSKTVARSLMMKNPYLDHFLQHAHDTRAKTSIYFLLFLQNLLF